MKTRNKGYWLLVAGFWLVSCSKLAPVDSASVQPKCGVCHGAPPSGLAHDTYALGQDCAVCHQGNSGLEGFTNAATHDNGSLNVTACGVCHGAPPASGAHALHVTAYGRDCGLCHDGNSAANFTLSVATHANGSADVHFKDTALVGSAAAFSTQGCSNVACHGQTRTSNPAYPIGVVWSAAPVKFTDQLSCTSCHTVNKANHHSAAGYACATCHFKTMAAGSDTVIGNPAFHGNGTVDLIQ